MRRLYLVSLILALVWSVAFCDEKMPPAHWKFDEASGSTVKDGSGNDNGMIHGATWVTGKSGAALYFDGIDDQVVMSPKQALTSKGFSISAWIYPEKAAGQQAIFSNGGSGVKGSGISFLVGDRMCIWMFDESGKRINGVTSKVIVPQKWQHVVFVFDGEKGFLYHNGRKCSEFSCGGFNAGANRIAIGRGRFGNIWQFHGAIDELMIGYKALADEEVSSLYEINKSASPAPELLQKE